MLEEKNQLVVTMEKRLGMAETLPVVLLLTISGGFQDAYSYLIRGGVFANAQTGNIVLMSSHLFELDFRGGYPYFFTIVAFATGVFVAEQLAGVFRFNEKMHWRQVVVVLEILILFTVGFLPSSMNSVANAMVSFSCAMQVQAFRRVNGYAYASTMCIGNMRSGVESFSAYLRTRDRALLEKSVYYFGVILVFALGAGIGSIMARFYGRKIIWFSSVVLLFAFLLMFLEEDVFNRKDE